MNNKIININEIKTDEDNTLNTQQLIDLDRKALKEEKFTYVFELNHNSGLFSSYEVEISANFNNHEIAYYIRFKDSLKDNSNNHCYATSRSYSSKEEAIELLISRLKTAQENYIRDNL